MAKPLVNNRITYPNIFGRIITHDDFLNQGVRLEDSPTFANLQLTGNATINGSLYVYGNTMIMNTNVTEFEDNILLLNRLETGPGVTLNQSGIEIERGSMENYRIVFNEPDNTFRSGFISDLRRIPHIENGPFNNGLVFWNNALEKLETRNVIDIDLVSTTTTESTNVCTGSLVLNGGLGVKKNISIDGNLYLGANTVLDATSAITLLPNTHVSLPFNKRLVFGSTAQSISADQASKNLLITTDGHIDFNLRSGYRINVPNQIPITFSTQNEKVYTDGDNNMVIAGSNDIILNPGTNKKTLVPETSTLAFYNNNQKIYGTITSDLHLAAANDIYLSPGLLKDIRIPVDNGVRFGNSSRMYLDSTDTLFVNATSGDIRLVSSTAVKLPVNLPLTFGNGYTESITADTFSNLLLAANNSVVIQGTQNASNATNGALVINGGASIGKNLFVQGNATFNGNVTVTGTTVTVNTETVLIKDNLLVLNSTPAGLYDSGLLMKRASGDYAGLFYKDSRNLMTFAFTNTDPGAGTITVSDYLGAEMKLLRITDTSNATNVSNGSINTPGGVSIGKDLIVGQTVYTPNANATTGVVTTCTIGTLLNTNQISTTSSIGSVNFNTGTVNTTLNLLGTQASTNLSTGTLVIAGGVTITNSTNAMGQNNGGALTVAGGMYIGGDIVVKGGLSGVGNATSSYGYLTLTSSDQAVNNSSGSLVTFGGITIQSTAAAQSATNGGGLLVMGGVGVQRNVIIAENMASASVTTDLVTVNGPIEYKGNGLLEYTNNVGWNYLGTMVNTDYTELHVSSENTTLFWFGSIKSSHLATHVTKFGESGHAKVVVYNTGSVWHVYVHTQVPSSIHVILKRGDSMLLDYEGNLSDPNGSVSGYNGLWSKVYDSDDSVQSVYSNFKVGDTTIQGTLDVNDNLSTFGDNTVESIKGIRLQRYQTENDLGVGEVAENVNKATDTFVLPTQTSTTLFQVKLPNTANATDNYYSDYWIRIGDQIRNIVAYNGAQRVLETSSPFTVTPALGDTIYMFIGTYSALYKDNNYFKLADISTNTSGNITGSRDSTLQLGSIIVTDTQVSTATTGTMVVQGGVSVLCTTDSLSTTSGGAMTVYGGVGIDGALRVKEYIYVGSNISFISTSDATVDFNTFKMHVQNNIFTLGQQTQTTGSLVIDNVGTISFPKGLVLIDDTQIKCQTTSGSIAFVQNTTGSRLLLDTSGAKIYSNTSGTVLLGVGNTSCVEVYSHYVNLRNTEFSQGASTGALRVDGGITIHSGQNSVNYTNGGSLTVLGGASVQKDLFVGGNLYITGNVQSTGASETPSVTFSNTVNCSISGYNNSQLIYVSNEALLTFTVSVNCTVASSNCQFEFNVPNRTNNFVSRSDIAIAASGYTDALETVYNIVGVAVTGTTRALVKLHSTDTSIHYIMVMCRYTAS
ncbi:hypothetical protein EB118_11400 [bacterium]|nr:hypothetical protein [bacterium]NDD83464.1 hypothetical protein [bacterium]NDG30663.1 hypothetical protein [bacterium]